MLNIKQGETFPVEINLSDENGNPLIINDKIINIKVFLYIGQVLQYKYSSEKENGYGDIKLPEISENSNILKLFLLREQTKKFTTGKLIAVALINFLDADMGQSSREYEYEIGNIIIGKTKNIDL